MKSLAILAIFLMTIFSLLPQEEIFTINLKNDSQTPNSTEKIRGYIIENTKDRLTIKLKDSNTIELSKTEVESITPLCMPKADKLVNQAVEELINKYKTLRVNSSNPEKKQTQTLKELLTDLGWELGHPPYTKTNIIKLLGNPNKVYDENTMQPYLGIYKRDLEKTGKELKENSTRKYLIYWWRGSHDFMFYIIENEIVIDHGWWFAYE